MSLIGGFAAAHKAEPELPNKICTLGLIGLQVFVSGVIYVAVGPGLIMPFFHQPIARWIFVGLLAWDIFGMFLLWSLPFKVWKALLIFLVFVVPLPLAPMVGPAVVTLVNAFAAR